MTHRKLRAAGLLTYTYTGKYKFDDKLFKSRSRLDFLRNLFTYLFNGRRRTPIA